jgi:hypothetical protein
MLVKIKEHHAELIFCLPKANFAGEVCRKTKLEKKRKGKMSCVSA